MSLFSSADTYRAFEEILSVSHDDISLSSPEVLRRLECSEERNPERFHASVHLSEISTLNNTGLDPAHFNKTSPRVLMERPHSRTITPDPPSRTTHSPGSVSMSDNFSMLDSLDTDRVCGPTHGYMLLLGHFGRSFLVEMFF